MLDIIILSSLILLHLDKGYALIKYVKAKIKGGSK